MLLDFTKFTRNSAGLEKTLRLLQASCHVAVELADTSVTATRWSTGKSQFALARRYFRFFNFIDCFHRVLVLLGGGDSSQGLLMTMLEIGRWSCLGLYLVLEDMTLLHAMNVYPVPWNKAVLTESFKFWFYSLVFSLVGAVIGLLWRPTTTTTTVVEEKGKGEKGKVIERKATKAPAAPLIKRIIVDGCDILLPGAFLGWINVSELVVGLAMVLSTLVAGSDIWSRTV